MWNPSPVPEISWNSEVREVTESWKGTIACFLVGALFVLTIGLIYWKVVDQPSKTWILTGDFSGLVWDRKRHSLDIQSLKEDKIFVQIDVGSIWNVDMHVPFVSNLCWLDHTHFCYEWDANMDVQMVLESNEASYTECYNLTWRPFNCNVTLKQCFSMANVYWYGGTSATAQKWPLNNMKDSSEFILITDLKNPLGYPSMTELYLLGSSGVAVLLSLEVPLHFDIVSNQKLCVQPQTGKDLMQLQYRVCVGPDLRGVQQDVDQSHMQPSKLPDMSILRSPMWKLLVNVDSGAKLERELRTLSNRLKRHHLFEGVISLDEQSTSLLLNMEASHLRSLNLPLVRYLNITVTFSPYFAVDKRSFQVSLEDGREALWLGRPARPQQRWVPALTSWKGEICVKLNTSNQAAVSWFLDRVAMWSAKLDVEYVILEVAEGNILDQEIGTLASKEYIKQLADDGRKISNSTILTPGTKSNDVLFFLIMPPRQSSWCDVGIKGIIPSLLHYSIRGYNFFIPDAVGGSLVLNDIEEELFIRWLEIVTFLPVISFQTPPWHFENNKVLSLTKFYISFHRDFVIPLVLKYASEWTTTQSPIYRPLWWVSPDDPLTFTIDDEFLIGSEALIAPMTEKGATQRNIYLPGSDIKWQDRRNGQIFDGGTFLKNYTVALEEVAIFMRINSDD